MALLGLFKKQKVASDLPPPPPPPIKFEEAGAELKTEIPEYVTPAQESLILYDEPMQFSQDIEIPLINMAKSDSTARKVQDLSMPQLPNPAPMPLRRPELKQDKTLIHEEMDKRDIPTKPVFVSAHDYSVIQNGVQSIRQTLAESESTIIRLGELKTNQDRIFGDWKTQLADMEKKLSYIDSIIFSGE